MTRILKTDRGISYNQEVIVNLLLDKLVGQQHDNITIICPKLARRLPKDEKFWKEVDQLVNSSESIIIIWPTNFNYTCYRADDVKEFLDKKIVSESTHDIYRQHLTNEQLQLRSPMDQFSKKPGI